MARPFWSTFASAVHPRKRRPPPLRGKWRTFRRLPLERLEERALLAGFSFTDFSAPSSLNLLADASITTDNRLRLTPAVNNQRGAAWYASEKQFVAEGFSTTFQFQIVDNRDPPAGSDGFAFAIQNANTAFVSGGGSNLGYNGLANSVVVEFDTFPNADIADPSESHISVHTAGTGVNSVNETFSLGSFSTSPIIDDAAVHTARITYGSGTLSVYLDDLATPALSVAVDLANTLALDFGDAWVGFTAATGGSYSSHDILSWQMETPTPPATRVAIGDASQVEGNSGTTEVVFALTRSGDISGTTTVDWATADRTATAGSDFVASSGQVTFSPGEASKSIAITVNGDSTVESHETFSVQLSNATGGGIVDNLAVGTVLNDEVNVSIADDTVAEGEGGYRFLDTFVAANQGGLRHGRSVAFGPDGNLYVGELGGPFVLRFNGETGQFMDVFAEAMSQGHETSQVLFHDGYLFVASPPNVFRFDALTGAPLPASGKTGALFATLGDQGVQSGTHAFAFGQDGNLYISNQNGNDILKYDGSTGSYLGVFVSAGSGGLSAPVGLTFGPDGHLYVGTNHGGTDEVLRFQGPLASNPGAFIDTFVPSGNGGLDRVPAGGIWFRPDGDLYISSGQTSSVLRYDGSTGAFIEALVSPGEGGLNLAGGHTFDAAGLLYVASQDTHEILRYAPATDAILRVSLSQPSAVPVTVSYATADSTALAISDYVASSGTVTFAPGETTRTILVRTLDDLDYEGNETFVVNLSNPSASATIVDVQGVVTIQDNDPPPTKFYVVNDATQNQTYEYDASGGLVESYGLDSGNAAPRGAASTTAGDKTWVVDANKKVYVYDASGALLGSWTAGSLASKVTIQGIATNGTDVWIVDAKSDKVFKYAGAAARLSGSQNADSSFALNSGNVGPKGMVTDGTHLWVVNNNRTDKVFKYTLAGSLVGSWTVSTSGAGSPTGITLDPSAPSHLWIVDGGTDRVYQYDNAVGRASGSQSASTSFALAAGNTNPQGIADPPPVAVYSVATAVVEAPRSKPVSPASTTGRTQGAGSDVRNAQGGSGAGNGWLINREADDDLELRTSELAAKRRVDSVAAVMRQLGEGEPVLSSAAGGPAGTASTRRLELAALDDYFRRQEESDELDEPWELAVVHGRI